MPSSNVGLVANEHAQNVHRRSAGALGGPSSSESWEVPPKCPFALGQHLGVNQCSEHISACDLIDEIESRLRSRQSQCQCRLLEIVGLDSHDEIFNLATCRGHCVVLKEFIKQAGYRVGRMLAIHFRARDDASSAEWAAKKSLLWGIFHATCCISGCHT